MCSVCWEWSPKSESYQDSTLFVIFNRDEQRSRVLATPPQKFEQNGVNVIYPVDPARGGTWITANEHGIIISLLNLYSVKPSTEKNYESRGNLVKLLSGSKSISETEEKLIKLLKLHALPAFSLIIWDTNEKAHQIFQWDESKLKVISSDLNFYSSSSWNTEEVLNYRTRSYRESVVSGKEEMLSFMCNPIPNREEWSVFMSREKTQTVSSTIVRVNQASISMDYFDRNSRQSSEAILNRLESSQ